MATMVMVTGDDDCGDFVVSDSDDGVCGDGNCGKRDCGECDCDYHGGVGVTAVKMVQLELRS